MVPDPNSYALRRAKTTNLLRGRAMDVRLRVVEFGGVWHWHVTEILLRAVQARVEIMSTVTEPEVVRHLLARWS